MPWTLKEHPHSLDHHPIPGLYFLIGSLLAQEYHQNRIQTQKYAMLSFPSGLEREVVSDRRTGKPRITLFKALSFSPQLTRDDAFLELKHLAEAEGYRLTRVGQDTLEAWDRSSGERYRLTFDNAARQLVNIEYDAREMSPKKMPRPMELLDAHSRALLPALYSMEPFGLDAIAVVKFFAPGSFWTWYATEFDGDDLFFGLVSGFEVELGMFSLSELEQVRGPFGLPIERDLYFKPTSLKVLQEQHHRQRGEL